MSAMVEVMYNTAVQEFRGDGKLKSVLLKNTQTGAITERHPAGVFVFIGQQPNSVFVKDLVELDKNGFIRTGHDLQHSLEDATMHRHWAQRPPFNMETSLPGVFAAGDVRAGATAQIASAAGEGASVAIAIREYLKMK